MDVILPGDYTQHILLVYENGKVGRVPLECYATKTNRKRLTAACSDKSALVCVLPLTEETECAIFTSEGRAVVFSTALLQPKTTRSTQGVGVARMKPKYRVTGAKLLRDTDIKNPARYRVRSIPALGAVLKEEDLGHEQLSLLEE